MGARIERLNWADGDPRPFFFAGNRAREALLSHAEDRLGQPIPSTLRRFFLDCTDMLVVDWAFRSRRIEGDSGTQRIITLEELPPDAFVQTSRGWIDGIERLTPAVWSGGIEISLHGMVRAFQARTGWVETYRDVDYGDDALKAHFNRIADYMEVGFPFATAPNGDWLAIDLRDGCERIMHVSHEGEEAGIEIDMTLPQFLMHQAMLGFPGIDYPELFAFAGGEIATLGGPDSPYVSEVPFDARGGDNPAWTDWFWDGVERPTIPDALFAQWPCGGPIG